jgi:hypothetical protein
VALIFPPFGFTLQPVRERLSQATIVISSSVRNSRADLYRQWDVAGIVSAGVKPSNFFPEREAVAKFVDSGLG